MPHFRNFHGTWNIEETDQFEFKGAGTDAAAETREHILLLKSNDDGAEMLLPAVQSAREAARYSDAPDDNSGWQGDVNMDGQVGFDDFMLA